MKRRPLLITLSVILAVILIGAASYLLLLKKPLFISGVNAACTSDADCKSAEFFCQAEQGIGTVSPNNSKPSTFTIVKGECKAREGNACSADSDCVAGLLCHNNICTQPIGPNCSGPSDNSCPSGYTCIQGCGLPVSYEGEPPAPYFCELQELASKPKNCPICLASNARIATPIGEISITQVRVGMHVWSLNTNGKKIVSTVRLISKTPTPNYHRVVHLVLSDKREVWVSPNHPSVIGVPVGQLIRGSVYDGARIVSSELVPYWDNATYDLLPDSDTGYYWANGVLLASTLKM